MPQPTDCPPRSEVLGQIFIVHAGNTQLVTDVRNPRSGFPLCGFRREAVLIPSSRTVKKWRREIREACRTDSRIGCQPLCEFSRTPSSHDPALLVSKQADDVRMNQHLEFLPASLD